MYLIMSENSHDNLKKIAFEGLVKIQGSTKESIRVS